MTNDERKKLGERLREAREYVGMKQEEVAARVGLPRTAVTLMESGNRRVEAIELAALAKVYQRPVSYFTGEDEEQEPPQLALLRRTASKLSDKDRDEVLRFAEYLRGRARSKS